MIVTVFVGVFSVLFAFLARYRNVQWGLKAAFAMIFLFLALRYNFGNDYSNYLKSFLDINEQNKINYFSNENYFEIGWVFLIRLFKPFGFFIMIVALALFNSVIYFRLIKKYVPVNYYWLAVFFYIFTPSFMLIQCSAMRQSIAIALFLFALDYIYNRNAIKYFLLMGIASLFHTSALILIPVYFLGLSNWKMNNKIMFITFSIFISLFIFMDFFKPLLDQFISNYFVKYEVYNAEGKVNSGLGIIYLSFLLLNVLYYGKFQTNEFVMMFKIATIGFMFIPISIIMQDSSRVSLYFTPFTIVVYPILYAKIKSSTYRILFLSMILFMTLYGFFIFFYSDTFNEAFFSYKTIFSARYFY